MSDFRFTIYDRLPSLNDVTRWNRANKYSGNQHKQALQDTIGWEIRKAKVAHTIEPVEAPVELLITFYEPSKRRDVDNVQSATKFILDALVASKILPNDNPQWVRQVYHVVKYTDRPEDKRVIVEMTYGTYEVIEHED